jgi:DNA-directed RNA polymerase subunit RPC12/RpoP
VKATTLVCDRCGADLEFEDGRERAVCSYCGARSVLVPEGPGERPVARTVVGHPPALFEAALAAADPDALADLCSRYVENVKAYSDGGGTHDEAMMRAVEETIDVPEGGKDAFRKGILNMIGALAIEGRVLEYGTSERFHRALAACLYLEGRRDG